MKNIIKQFKSLSDISLQMSMSAKPIYMGEIAARGGVAEAHAVSGDFYAIARQLAEITGGKSVHMLTQNASQVFCDVQPESFASPNGGTVGFPFINGQGESLSQLVRLVASPATKYIHQHMPETCEARPDSLQDTQFILYQWCLAMLEVGRRVDDPNLTRCCRLLTLMPGEDGGDNVIVSPGVNKVTKEQWNGKQSWDLFLDAVKKHELAYAAFATDLWSASRITLDHLIEMYTPRLAIEIAQCLSGGLIDFTWIRMADIHEALVECLGKEEALSKSTLSRYANKEYFTCQGDQKCLEIQLDSFIAWMSKNKYSKYEVESVETAAIKFHLKRVKQKG